MDQLVPVLILLALFAGALALMLLGWRRRAAAQRGIAAPAAPGSEPARDGGGASASCAGVYVCTVLADRPLERVVAHGLGVRSRVRVTRLGTGDWILEREGAPSLQILASQIRGVATAPGMAGKVVGGDGLLVLRWDLGGTRVDTGLRTDRREDHERLLAAEVPA